MKELTRFLFIGDRPIALYLGIILFVLLLIQFLTSMRKGRTVLKIHRRNGKILLVLAMIHALSGLLLYAV